MRVAVIGGGVIGLTTAIILLRKGYDVQVYTAELHPYITSSQACAIWLPVWTTNSHDVPDGYDDQMSRWCSVSWDVFCTLVGDEYGIHWKTNYEMWPGDVVVPRYLYDIFPDLRVTTTGIMPPGFEQCWSCRTLVIETPVYMTRLFGEFRKSGGELTYRRFATVDDICSVDETIIFNCTGMNARQLFGDASMYEVKGQLLLHEPVDLDFAFGAGDFCLIPRTDALVLGSLFQPQFDSIEPTAKNADMLWSTISAWCQLSDSVMHLPAGTLDRSKIIGTIAGARPYRSRGVRLEAEEVQGKLIIHDYGHGGGGVTLSWGCAQHAVSLLEHRA